MADLKHAKYLMQTKIKMQNRIAAIYDQDEEMFAVDNARLPVMPQGSAVILSQDVYEALSVVQDVTRDTNKEYPFFLMGRVDGQVVYFDKFTADSKNSQGTVANFSQFLINKLTDFIAVSPKDGSRIVAHGHSHPKLSDYYLNFSLGDMTGYMEMQDDNPVFKSKQIELCSVLLAGGNYNFLFYDGNDYYKFSEVFYQDKNGALHPVPCYGTEKSNLMTRVFNGGRNS